MILTIPWVPRESREAPQKKWKRPGGQTLWAPSSLASPRLSSFARSLLFNHPLLSHEAAVPVTGPARGAVYRARSWKREIESYVTLDVACRGRGTRDLNTAGACRVAANNQLRRTEEKILRRDRK